MEQTQNLIMTTSLVDVMSNSNKIETLNDILKRMKEDYIQNKNNYTHQQQINQKKEINVLEETIKTIAKIWK